MQYQKKEVVDVVDSQRMCLT